MMTNQLSSLFLTILEVLLAFDTILTHTVSKQVAKGKLSEHIRHECQPQ